jgi:hypothetical protein
MPSSSEFSPLKQSHSDTGKNAKAISSIDPKLSRSHYFDGRLLKASDLIRDQHYLDERLNEVGRVLGQGIVSGLELSLSEQGVLSVSTGIAVSESGRVLELERQPLSIDLYDSAQISALNANTGQRGFERGLYIVALEYAQVGSGSTEIYPKDLTEQRGFHFNAFAEGVELVLDPLQTSTVSYRANAVNDKSRLNASLSARSALVKELISNAGQPPQISSQAIALGLISFEVGRVAWIDSALVRRPMRALNQENSLQQDLRNHYQELLQDVLDFQRQSTREYPFAAADYFSLLPPVGSVPKRCIDPLKGSQQFFPKHFEVQITPVRQGDLNTLFNESEALQVIDLEDKQSVDIMLLIPFSDDQFTHHARVLQQFTNDQGSMSNIRHIPSLTLQLYGDYRLQIDQLQLDAWQGVWQKADQVYFVRRPARVAQTQVNAVVLAQGYAPLEDEQGSSLSEELNQLRAKIRQALNQINALVAENTRLENRLAEISSGSDSAELNAALAEIEQLNQTLSATSNERDQLQLRLDLAQVLEVDLRNQITRLEQEIEQLEQKLSEQGGGEGSSLSIEEMLHLRKTTDSMTIETALSVAEITKGDDKILSIINRLAVSVDSRYDEALWQTILALIENKNLDKFFDEYQLNGIGMSPEDFMLEMGPQFEIKQSLIDQWFELGKRLNQGADFQNGPRLSSSLEIETGLKNIRVTDLESLARGRLFNDQRQIKALIEIVDKDENLVRWVNEICYLISPVYDDILWRSMSALIKGEHTKSFKEYVINASLKASSIGISIAATTAFGMSVSVRNKWRDKDLA